MPYVMQSDVLKGIKEVDKMRYEIIENGTLLCCPSMLSSIILLTKAFLPLGVIILMLMLVKI
jgi:hypothetical protein